MQIDWLPLERFAPWFELIVGSDQLDVCIFIIGTPDYVVKKQHMHNVASNEQVHPKM